MIINAEKANRLFWLGRYVERGYLTLHLIRRAYDEAIDTPRGQPTQTATLALLRQHTGQELVNSRAMMAHIYDETNATSLHAIVDMMMNNAMLLRSELCSETLSYVEMTHALITRCAAAGDTNITSLQPVTDYLLAFWGSTGERVFGTPLVLLLAGRYVEHIDMNIRFRYQHYRLTETWGILTHLIATTPDLFDPVQAHRITALLDEEKRYEAGDASLTAPLLAALSVLVKV